MPGPFSWLGRVPGWLWIALGGGSAAFVTYRIASGVGVPMLGIGSSLSNITGRDPVGLTPGLPSYARHLGPIFLQVGQEKGIDPYLLAAVASRESRFGTALDSSGRGDNGRGHGIMQIDIGSFPTWIATHDWRDPLTNIRKGADVLLGKLKELSGTGSFGGGLSRPGGVYIGPSAASRRGISPGWYPDPRPLTGEQLIRGAIAAYNTGAYNVTMSVAAGLDPDWTTTGADYQRDVIARANGFASGVA